MLLPCLFLAVPITLSQFFANGILFAVDSPLTKINRPKTFFVGICAEGDQSKRNFVENKVHRTNRR